MRLQAVDPGLVIAAIAARQHGVITFAQLIAAGLTQSGIQRRVASGHLHRIYRAVYAVGHPGLSLEGKWKAATLACGEGAALSHRSAAELWRMLEPRGGPIHVTVPTRGGGRRTDGICRHRSPSLPSATTSRLNIPVTTPQRTLEDIRRPLPAGVFRRALRQAEFLQLPVQRLDLARDRAGNQLELSLLGLCRRHRLPEPEVNVRIEGFEVDFLWRDQRLVVETDGYEAHRGSVAFEEDRRRDATLTARGYTVLRFTYWQVVNEASYVAARIGDCLGRHPL